MATANKMSKDEIKTVAQSLDLMEASHQRKAMAKAIDEDLKRMYTQKADAVRALRSKITNGELEL